MKKIHISHEAVIKIQFYEDDSKVFACNYNDDTTLLINLKTKEELKRITTHFNSHTSIYISKNLLFYPNRENICIFDLEKEEMSIKLDKHNLTFDTVDHFVEKNMCRDSMAISNDCKFVAGNGKNGQVMLCNLEKKLVSFLCGHEGIVQSVSFSKTGLLASGSMDCSIIIWDVTNRKRIKQLRDPELNSIFCVQFSPHDTILASADCYHNIFIWDVSSGNLMNKTNFYSQTFCVAFSPICSDIIAVPFEYDGFLCLWNFKTGKVVRTMEHSAGGVYDICFSKNSRKIGCCGTGLYVWHLDEVDCITRVVSVLAKFSVTNLLLLNIVNFILAQHNTNSFETESNFMFKQKIITICDALKIK